MVGMKVKEVRTREKGRAAYEQLHHNAAGKGDLQQMFERVKNELMASYESEQKSEKEAVGKAASLFSQVFATCAFCAWEAILYA